LAKLIKTTRKPIGPDYAGFQAFCKTCHTLWEIEGTDPSFLLPPKREPSAVMVFGHGEDYVLHVKCPACHSLTSSISDRVSKCEDTPA
jgi:hypothetical protein